MHTSTAPVPALPNLTHTSLPVSPPLSPPVHTLQSSFPCPALSTSAHFLPRPRPGHLLLPGLIHMQQDGGGLLRPFVPPSLNTHLIHMQVRAELSSKMVVASSADDLSDVRVMALVGKGTFGRVYKGETLGWWARARSGACARVRHGGGGQGDVRARVQM